MHRREFLTVAAGALAAFAPVPAASIEPKPIGWAKDTAESPWRPVFRREAKPVYAVVACYADAA